MHNLSLNILEETHARVVNWAQGKTDFSRRHSMATKKKAAKKKKKK
jgi:hypothetical protein